jgi:hypothetical protein
VEKPEPRDAPASRATGDALLARLEALQPLQRLAALLLAGDEQLAALPAQQISDLTASAWQQCNPGLLHRLHPAGYWDAVAAACPLAASTLGSAAAMRAISLVGLLVRANRPEVLECLDPDCTDPYLAAAEIDAAGSTRTLSALGLALDFGCDSFIAWSARHWSQLDPQPRRHEKALTRLLSAAIESWSAGTRPASAMRMVMAMLQMGALLDRRHLLLLASRDSTGDAVEAWDALARAAHDTDPHGLAALQLLVSAATFNYGLSPHPGGANPMARYAAGDHPRAVEMFMQSGFDPLLPGAQELSPRDHGARYLASRALAAIDLYLAQNRLEALRQSAENLRELDGLLGFRTRH